MTRDEILNRLCDIFNKGDMANRMADLLYELQGQLVPDGVTSIIDELVGSGLCGSRSQAIRKCREGAVKVDGVTASEDAVIGPDQKVIKCGRSEAFLHPTAIAVAIDAARAEVKEACIEQPKGKPFAVERTTTKLFGDLSHGEEIAFELYADGWLSDQIVRRETATQHIAAAIGAVIAHERERCAKVLRGEAHSECFGSNHPCNKCKTLFELHGAILHPPEQSL